MRLPRLNFLSAQLAIPPRLAPLATRSSHVTSGTSSTAPRAIPPTPQAPLPSPQSGPLRTATGRRTTTARREETAFLRRAAWFVGGLALAGVLLGRYHARRSRGEGAPLWRRGGGG